jgi:hypothetical protein
MSTLKTTNLQHASAASPAIVLAADGNEAAWLAKREEIRVRYPYPTHLT